MKLNKLEFFLMNNPFRAFIQERYELPILRKMVSAQGLERVLEIGCGNGAGTRLINKYFSPGNITAIDLDEKMIQIAEKNNRAENISFMVMDASKLDFPDNAFDAIFNFGIIHHIPNWKKCLNELQRVLKKNGELILEDLSIESFSGFPGKIYRSFLAHPYEQMYSIDDFTRYAKGIGFTIRNFQASNPMRLFRFFSMTAGKQKI
ncbi:MAG: class I SAM-dependent methyltransferase [Desulfobacterales bacterium]